MSIALVLLLLTHGALHLIGFVRPVDGSDRLVPLLWLGAFGLFVTAASLRAFDRPSWWIVAAIGIALSQALVISHWSEAKAGTAVNLVVALVVLVSGATDRFHRRAAAEARAILASAPASSGIVQRDELASLPPPVAHWLERSGIVGRERATTVRLRQRGELHTANDAPWMPVNAVQYFDVRDPGFVWTVDATMAKVLPIVGRDAYAGGRGEMWIRAGGLVDVAKASGPDVDRAALIRYLAEIIWFPSAALEPYVTWEEGDAAHARATVTNRGVTGSAVFTFDDRGRVTAMTSKRPYGEDGRLETWGGRITEWKTFGGVEIAARGEVVWSLATGDFPFFRWEIVDLETNRPFLYGEEPRAAAPKGERISSGEDATPRGERASDARTGMSSIASRLKSPVHTRRAGAP